MIIQELLNGVKHHILQGSNLDEVHNLTYDSREAKKGVLFVCIKGFKDDGHKYIQKAYENGALAFLIEDDSVKIPKDATVIKVDDARSAIPIIAANFYEHPSKKMGLIGITGTNGKTSVTSLIASVLESIGNKVGTIGTLGNRIGEKELTVKRTTPTTPEAIDLQSIFNQMSSEKVDNVVMEVSSMALRLHRVDSCDFDIGIFTNLTQDHLDDHGTMEDYKKSKLKLFKKCNSSIVNIDDPIAKEVISECKGKVTTYGIQNNADIRASNISMSALGVKFTVHIGDLTKEVSVPTPGKFTIYNALATIGACLNLGFNINEIIKGLANTNGALGRFQTIETPGGYSVIVDYAHTPDALENILETVQEFVSGKVLIVFGCGGDRDKLKRPLMGKIAAKLADFCFITSDNPRSENPDAIIKDIELGIKEITSAYSMIEDRKEAIYMALDRAQSNDVVVIAGKGNETYQIIGNKTLPFDDVKVVKEYWKI
ncbi:UDP-N-acetylmuramoyl-L-alanyl-D-glutamate--2,6-diaminopimelate ligase [Bacillus sp. FSL W7-1334]|uniref:UDP-N-acetylmuramoyl-L-alanyl-D-glutamate--2, 6-diaminopimelate ligase n=1 Tax=Bacillus sp. FSL W7-1334 TaxID=2921703 RepID=UPI0030F58643|nr:UDP-N-acetylmuramoyl-L-alanyl-D-glutamate--2,6-diaminopimelate ligase [Bacillus cereus]